MPVPEKELKTSIKDLNKSVTKLDSRVNKWWKILLHGMLQGAGAVIGAALVFSLLGLLLNIAGVLPYIGDTALELKGILDKVR